MRQLQGKTGFLLLLIEKMADKPINEKYCIRFLFVSLDISCASPAY